VTTYRFFSVQKCSAEHAAECFLYKIGYQVIADDVTATLW